jgi:hypothetical protein
MESWGAVRLALPGELTKHAVSEGTKAVDQQSPSTRRPRKRWRFQQISLPAAQVRTSSETLGQEEVVWGTILLEIYPIDISVNVCVKLHYTYIADF